MSQFISIVISENNFSRLNCIYKEAWFYIRKEVGNMEINIEVKYDDINSDLSRSSDELFRDIQRRFPEGIWEKSGLGYKVMI